MAMDPKAALTPQGQLLEAVKEYVLKALAEHEQKTMAALNAMGNRLDEMVGGGETAQQPDPATRTAWLRETALRTAADMYRDSAGKQQANRAEIIATAKAFEAFLAGEPEEVQIAPAA